MPDDPQYRPIEGFPGYRVGNDGSVCSCRLIGPVERIGDVWHRLKPTITKKGYQRVGLCRDGKVHNIFVHKLVLEAFVGPRPDGMEARHFPDRTKTNNHVSNLRWDTPLANAADREFHGTQARGSKMKKSHLTDQNIIDIREQCQRGVPRRTVAKAFGVGHATINDIANRKSWTHVPEREPPNA